MWSRLLSVYIYVYTCIFMNSLFGGCHLKMGLQTFYLSWMKGSFGAINIELNWVFLEQGGDDARNLVELSKAVCVSGGVVVLLSVPLKEGCALLTNFKLLWLRGSQLENFKRLNWPFKHGWKLQHCLISFVSCQRMVRGLLHFSFLLKQQFFEVLSFPT